MFRLDVLETDAFMDMPLSTQALYFHLNLRADDDGFIGNPKMIVRNIGASMDDFNLLLAKRFVLQFESGVIVVKHWRMHNTLSKGRYHETNFTDEKRLLLLKDNGAYSFTEGNPIDDSRQIEMGQRQALPKPAKCEENEQTNNRRTIDEQKTTIGLGLGLGIDKEYMDIYACTTTANIANSSESAENESVEPSQKRKRRSSQNAEVTEKISQMFEVFWKAYPRHKDKQYAKNAFAKLKPTDELLEKMLVAIEAQKKTKEWQKDKGQYIPYPSSWLNAQRWEDEIGEEEVPKTLEEIMAEV